MDEYVSDGHCPFMYRFLLKKIITLDEYYEFKSGFIYKSKNNKETKKNSSGGNYYATRKDKFSKKFISLISSSYKNETISMNEAFNYLGVKDSNRFEEMTAVTKQ
jgi:hypothetical protein